MVNHAHNIWSCSVPNTYDANESAPILFLLLLVVSFSSQAQQNLFNAPSGDLTPRSELFYQHQINLYSPSLWDSKIHLVYGLGKKWDAGINFVDLPIDWSQGLQFSKNDLFKPYYPVLMATAQKQWELSKRWDMNIGTQAGINVGAEPGRTQFLFWNYSSIRYHLKRSFVIGGLYQTNSNYVGEANDPVGYWFGYQIDLNDRWLLIGDFTSGDHKKSGSTLGIVYNLSNRVQLCLAGLFGFPNSKNRNGFVFELNVFTYNYHNN